MIKTEAQPYRANADCTSLARKAASLRHPGKSNQAIRCHCKAVTQGKGLISIFFHALLASSYVFIRQIGSQIHVPKDALICRAWGNAWIIEIHYAVKQGCVRLRDALKCIDSKNKVVFILNMLL